MTGFMNADGSALMGGLSASGMGQALQIDALGNLLTQGWSLSMAQQGRGYTASTGLLNVAAGNYPLCIFNPASSGKNVLVYSLHVSSGTTGASAISVFLQTVTVNPTYTSAALVTNNRLGGGASVLAGSCTFATTSQTLAAPYVQVEFATAPIELLVNGSSLLLPNGAANGVTVFFQSYAAGFSSITAKWLEF